MAFIPVQLGVSDLAVVQLDEGVTLHLTPFFTTIGCPQAMEFANTESLGDDFNIFNRFYVSSETGHPQNL